MGEPIKEPVFLKLVITADVYKKIDDFKAKWPGVKTAEVMVRVEVGDGHAHETECSMDELLSLLGFEDAMELIKPCATCNGEGTVATDESDGEGHYMRGVGEAKCPDCLPETDNDADDR